MVGLWEQGMISEVNAPTQKSSDLQKFEHTAGKWSQI